MTGQESFLPPPPRLGPAQAYLYAALREAREMTSAEAGVVLHLRRDCRLCARGREAECPHVLSDGRKTLEGLRRKGLVRRTLPERDGQRREVWTLAGGGEREVEGYDPETVDWGGYGE